MTTERPPQETATAPAPDPSAPFAVGPESGFLAAVLNNLSDALVACDARGELTLFNPAARELHGLPALPLAPDQWSQYYDLLLPDGRTPMPVDQVPLLRALRGEQVRDVEMVVAPAGQEPRLLRASGQRILGPDGEVTGAVVVMHDVTAGAAAEIARAEQVREQEQRQAAERALRRLQQLNAAALAINEQHTVDDVLQAITRQAASVIGAEQSVVSLTRSEDWSQAINAVVLSDKYARWSGYEATTDGTGIYALVCETNRPVRLTQAELEQHPRWRGFGAHAPAHPPMRGWLAAPLVRRDGSNLGLVQLSDKQGVDRAGRPLEFDETDQEALVQLAQVASLALEKAVEFQREHEVAVELQRALLPVLPAIDGLTVEAAYVPGRDEADLAVAGDLYDVFALDDEHVALALGDVMGHGLMSASLMGQIRSALRALALVQHDPVVVVTALDRLVATLAEDAMATLAYGVLHLGTGRLRLVLAGHPAPLLRPAPDDGGDVVQLPADPGLPLGALPGSGYVATENVLPPGATLLLFSDGLVEGRGRSIDAGIDRLAAALAAGPAPLPGLSEHLLARMTAGQNDDDVAVLLVRRDDPTTEEAAVPEVQAGPEPLELPADSTAPGTARAHVRRLLLQWGRPDLVDAVVLLVSEVVTNALLHAGSSSTLRVEQVGAGVRVTVVDASSVLPVQRGASQTSTTGRGVRMLHDLADAWGAEASGDGKQVWFVVAGERDPWAALDVEGLLAEGEL